MTKLVTARELADLLGLAPGTVLDKWERGDLPGFKIGRAVRFDPDEILALTRRERRQATAVAQGSNAGSDSLSPL